MTTGEPNFGIPAGKKPAIKDVARLAGVAVGTVSNVLNGKSTVTPETTERVRAVIAQLGYVPNANARRLRSGEITTIGAVVLDIANPFFTEMVRGVEDRLADNGFTLMLASSDEDGARERRYLDLLVEQGVRGLLVTPSSTDLDQLREIRDRGTDVVLLDAYSKEFGSVGVDDVAGGALAGAHVLDGGRRRITMFNGPRSVRQCADRYQGVERAIVTNDLDAGDHLTEITLQAPLTADLGDEATTAMLASGGPVPDAIVCINDIVALGVLRALARAGVRVPDDVAVVGYDDIMFASMLAIPLTSVRQPTRKLGWTATDILLGGETTESRHIEFAPELIVRASSA